MDKKELDQMLKDLDKKEKRYNKWFDVLLVLLFLTLVGIMAVKIST